MITDIFFDFFGTLVTYDPSVLQSGTIHTPTMIARRMGHDIVSKDCNVLWEQTWGQCEALAQETDLEYSLEHVIEAFCALLGSRTPTRSEVARAAQEYLEYWTRPVGLAPNAAEVLQELSGEVRFTIVSNTHSSTLVPAMMHCHGLDRWIDTAITSIDVGWSKPASQIFHFALETQGACVEQTLFVGDSWVPDVEGPRAIGMEAFYVGPARPGVTVHTLADLPAYIRNR